MKPTPKVAPNAAASYSRYSTDRNQSVISIIDQQADHQRQADRENWMIVEKYADEAKTSRTQHNRPGLAKMKADAKAGKFKIIIVEAQDRLWADEEDMWGLFNRFTAWGVKIYSLAEGWLDHSKITMGGLVTSYRIKNIADKTKRGHRGSGDRGRFYSVAFGYRRVELIPATADRPAVYDKGAREKHPENAKTLLRIYEETAAGRTPRAICADLSRDGIISPNGTTRWNASALTGGSAQHGMLGNELYKGVQVTGQTSSEPAYDDNDRKVWRKKLRPESEWKRTPVPHLQIIPTALWEAANRVVASRVRSVRRGQGSNVVSRKQHLLAGMLRCEVCGGSMMIVTKTKGSSRVACAAADRYSTCAHRKSYDLATLQAGIVAGMETNMLDSEALARHAKGYVERKAAQGKRDRKERATIEKRLAEVAIEQERAADGYLKTKAAVFEQRVTKLETELKALQARLEMIQAEDNVAQHPTVFQAASKAKIKELIELLKIDPHGHRTRFLFRNYFSHFVVKPTSTGADYQFTPVAHLGALLGMELLPAERSVEEIVAAEAVSGSDNAHPMNVGCAISHQVISLGLWSAAA